MGCKNITPKRGNNEKKGVGEFNETLETVRKGNSNQAPTAGAQQVRLTIKYQGKIILVKTYRDEVKVELVVNDIDALIPQYNKYAVYSYTVRGEELGDKLDSQIKTLLTASGQITKGKTVEEIEVEVFLLGLKDIHSDANKAYNNVKLLGKPLTDPFEIVVFNKETGRINLQNLTEKIQLNSEIAKFSDLSAYCNGSNHLFISGGETNNSQILGHFWDIDLSKQTVFKTNSGLITPRKLHSMIWIPSSYVFVVGGLNVKQVEYYHTEKRELNTHSELNEERTEPALALINNCFLYAFSGFLNGKTNSFERINLNSDSKTWELVKPKITHELVFTQNFFAVANHNLNEVIFLGGLNVSSLGTKTEESHSFIYDYNSNEIKKSQFQQYEMEFSEKFFIPIQEGNNIVLPQFSRENISLARFTNQEGLKEIQFETDHEQSEEDLKKNEFTLLQDEEVRLNEFVAKENLFVEVLHEDKFEVPLKFKACVEEEVKQGLKMPFEETLGNVKASVEELKATSQEFNVPAEEVKVVIDESTPLAEAVQQVDAVELVKHIEDPTTRLHNGDGKPFVKDLIEEKVNLNLMEIVNEAQTSGLHEEKTNEIKNEADVTPASVKEQLHVKANESEKDPVAQNLVTPKEDHKDQEEIHARVNPAKILEL